MDIEVIGQKYWLYGIRGTVKDVQKWTSTSVQSSGGSLQRVADGVYHMNAPQISSTTNQHQEFWIVSASGREWKVAGNYDVRAGQTVFVIWGNIKGNNSGYNLVIKNDTTGSTWTNADSLHGKINRSGTGNLTFRYLIAMVIGVLFITITSHPRYYHDGAMYVGDIVVPCIMWILFMMVIGFFHLVRKIRGNQKKALSEILNVIDKNPQFVKSLEA